MNAPLSLYRVSDGPAKKTDLVFIHGLQGSAAQTWSATSDRSSFWPTWLSSYANVWVLEYPADVFWWAAAGADMALPERARSVADLIVNHELGTRPTIFVAHSLGGLLVKSVLRAAHDTHEPKWKELLNNTRGIVFLGTPHTGAGLGTLADALRIVGITKNASQLKSNEPHLIDLSGWYSKNAAKLGIRPLAYYEKGRVKGIKVVDEGSADPRVQDCTPIPSDANHFQICKPSTKSDPIYMGVLRFVESIFGKSQAATSSRKQSGQNYNIDTVFGIHKGDTFHYVEREAVDIAFINHLVGERHLCIYGSSKQGKTALRKMHIHPSEEVAVVCERSWTAVDVFKEILTTATNGGIHKSANDPSPSVYAVNTSGSVLTVDLNHTADFLRALDTCFAGKYVVVEEFHYLADHVQKEIASKLKAIHELSNKLFIIIGVWLEHNRLVHLNKDLTGRVAPINADAWCDEDLSRVISEGEEKLNIRFPKHFSEALVSRACGSVFLVREACYRACEIAQIYKRVETTVSIDQSLLSVSSILKDIINTGVDYPGQIVSLMGIDDSQLHEYDREEGLKEWILRTLVTASAKEMLRRIKLKRLRTLIQRTHPRGYHPSERQTERVLNYILAIQFAKGAPTLFDYDRLQRMVRCVDKGFILWRTGISVDKLQHLMFEGEMPTDDLEKA